MPERLPRFQKGQVLSHRDLNALSEAISERERGDFQRARKRQPAEFLCKIVPTGPGGEPSFADSRYWVRQSRLRTALPPNGAIPAGIDPIAFGTSTPVWAEAINLSEVIGGTHGLALDTVVRVFELRDWAGQAHFVFTSAASPAALEDVKIAYVVDCSFGDCDGEELNNSDVIAGLTGGDGRHLRCYTVDINGVPRTAEAYKPTLPNTGHTIDEFADVAWDINSSTQTSFLAFANDGVWRMASFGEGERWVDPPTNLCSQPEPGMCCQLGDCLDIDNEADCTDAGATWTPGQTCTPGSPCESGAGACCEKDGTCTDDVTQQECETNGGSFIGSGTSCTGFGGMCEEPELGICCCDETADCYNDLYPPPSCWANATETECIAGGGVWDGTTGGQCPATTCGLLSGGACCMPGGTCQDMVDDVACGKAGGVFFAGESCDPSPCVAACKNPEPPLGACCNGTGGCFFDATSEGCCAIFGGIWMGDGSSCADC